MTDYITSCPSSVSSILPNVYILGYRVGQSIGELMAYISTNNSEVISTTATEPAAQMTATIASSSWLSCITTFPGLYKEWWFHLYSNDPTHVYVETTLLIAIVYFLVSRRSSYSKNWKDRDSDKLSLSEEEELLFEWKDRIRQPLAPPLYDNNNNAINSRNNNDWTYNAGTSSNNTSNINGIIVHKNNSRLLEIEYNLHNGSEQKKTVLNFATFDFLAIASDDPIAIATSSSSSTNESNNDQINTNDFVDTITTATNSNDNVEQKLNNTISMNIISPERPEMIKNPVKQAALKALDRYGCGSCGPRGFYGTVDVHLQLEKQFSTFMATNNAILYSDAASTVSSTIAAFCKRGDLLVVDEACYEPIMTGVLLSRANVKLFKHNDMDDLRAVMERAYESDRKLGRKPNAQRRFVVVEGLYKNTGSICPLDVVVQLKHKYHYRLILDESYSFGALGATGKGCCELYDQKLMSDAEIVTVSIENALGSIGGMTIGTDEVVDHQRLCGAGYCFSASSPPFTAAAAMEALNVIDTYGIRLLSKLNANRSHMYQQLSNMLSNEMEDLLFISSDERSPIIMLQLASNIPETEYIDENTFFHEIVSECLHTSNVAFIATGSTATKETTTNKNNQRGDVNKAAKSNKSSSNTRQPMSDNATTTASRAPPPRIRITVTAAHTIMDIDLAVIALRDAIDVVMDRYCPYDDDDDVMNTSNNDTDPTTVTGE